MKNKSPPVALPPTIAKPRIAHLRRLPFNGGMTAKSPVVAIVGRPNVGKSSLLNALVGKRISIVQDMPGVTRDRVSTHLALDGRFIELVDTGGYGFVDPDQLTDHIRQQIEIAMARADLVVLVVDTQAGLTSADEQMASMLRRQGIKTLLVANKDDGSRLDSHLGEFARLGFGTPLGVSAMNERNIDELKEQIKKNVDLADAPTEMPEPEMYVAIVGKRNAGKSTLVNAIAGLYEGDPNRVIVSEVPGTTRDSVDVRFEKEGKTMVVIDTAGVRKKRHMVTDDIEFYSFHRAQRSIRRADVVMLLIDGMERISEPDKKLAQYVVEQFKPVVVVVNKWDLVLENAKKQAQEKETGFSSDLLMEEFREYLDLEIKNLDYAPVAFITAKDGKKVQAVLDLAQHLFNQSRQRVTTGRLNATLRQVLQERAPSTPFGRKAKIFYATQVETNPPTIMLVANNPDYIDDTYQRFIINRFRELLPYPEVPIRLQIRGRGQRGDAKSLDEVDEAEVRDRASAVDEERGQRPAPKKRERDHSKVRRHAGKARAPGAKTNRGDTKPHPKGARSKGAKRGTRPHR